MSISYSLIHDCEKPDLSTVDEMFLKNALLFYIACNLIKNPISQENVSNGVHDFICKNGFSIIPTIKGKSFEELNEHIGKKTGELLQVLSNYVYIDTENMQLESKKAEEASNVLYESIMSNIK